jgi:hypothetical protein
MKKKERRSPADVLSASTDDDTIVWFGNDGVVSSRSGKGVYGAPSLLHADATASLLFTK